MSNSTLKIAGLVLRTFVSGESDLVLRILTETSGKISCIAKFARKSKKRFSGQFDIFDYGTFHLSSSSRALPVVNTFVPKGRFLDLRENLDKLCAASLFLESIDKLLKEGMETDQDLYASTLNTINYINNSKDISSVLKNLSFGLIKLLSKSGIIDTSVISAPTPNSLRFFINTIEAFVDNPLQTKTFVEDLINKSSNGSAKEMAVS